MPDVPDLYHGTSPQVKVIEEQLPNDLLRHIQLMSPSFLLLVRWTPAYTTYVILGVNENRTYLNNACTILWTIPQVSSSLILYNWSLINLNSFKLSNKFNVMCVHNISCFRAKIKSLFLKHDINKLVIFGWQNHLLRQTYKWKGVTATYTWYNLIIYLKCN